ncbi:MAG: hypothetical protein ACR2RV_26315, partial [Verrucomicrobiales bacterium]
MPSTQQPAAPSPGGRRQKETQGRRPFLWTRRLSYLCGWLVLLIACLAGLAAGLLTIGYHNATPLANLARQQLAPDYPVEVGSVSFPQIGVIELQNVTIDLPSEDRRAGEVERVRIGYDESDLLKPRARSLLVQGANIVVDNALLAMFASEPDPEAPPPNLSWAKLDTLEVIDSRIEFRLEGVPRGSWRVELEADDLDLGRAGPLLSRQPQRIRLRDFVLADPADSDATPPVVIDEIVADLALNKDFTSGAVAKLRLKQPRVRFTPEFFNTLRPQGAAAAPAADDRAAPPSSSATPMRWSIDEITLETGRFEMNGFYDTPDVRFDHSGTFTSLTWSSDGGLSWPGKQQATLTNVRVDAHAHPRTGNTADEPGDVQLLRAARIDIAGEPDEFFEHGWIDQITARKPEIQVSKERLGRFFAATPEDISKLLLPPADNGDTIAEPAADSAPAKPGNVIRVRDLEIADAQVKIEADGFLGNLPETSLTLNLRSTDEQAAPLEDIDYLMSATDFRIYAADAPEAPIVTGTEILSEFSAAGVQGGQRIDRVTVSGLDVRIGEEVERIIADLGANSSPAPDDVPAADPDDVPAADAPPPPELGEDDDAGAEWIIGQL